MKGEAKPKRECPECRRMRDAADLNIEGTLHHGTRVICLDRKSCERAKRKTRR